MRTCSGASTTVWAGCTSSATAHFVKGTPADLLSATSGDFDATGTVPFETYNGRVVTVDYASDNSTTLAKRNVCTVYGTAISS